MDSNFAFLKKEMLFSEIALGCIEAEKSFLVSNSTAVLQIRRALEIGVKWVYRYDADLAIPYQDNLSSLIHDYRFKSILSPGLFERIRFIITLGNKAAHSTVPVTRLQAIESLKNLYDFTRWLDYAYAKVPEARGGAFNPGLVPASDAIEKKNRRIQEALAAREAELQAREKKLSEQLASIVEREEAKKSREENKEARDFVCTDISEFQTRKIYIDLALEMAGWRMGTDCREEVEVRGMPGASGIGKVDYVLYGDNGAPLAVVEAKRTSKDPATGKQQAKLYADCLEARHGVRPLIFYTNGFETWLWDDRDYPERTVSGFFTKGELEWVEYRKANREKLESVDIEETITGRPYQRKAIQAVCDSFQRKERRALLVMATGSGKTRTAASIVDVLQRYGWVKNVLFLADRRELVKQAKNAFAEYLPSLSLCNLLDSSENPESRMVFSTYPTIMNAIDSTRRKDGSRLFGCGHFDLIILDESHRSIYKKYKDIFRYFDGMLLGLTATPKSEIDKNTYTIFELENDNPTYAYELEEAIEEKFLVPYNTVETKIKFMEEGIHYDDLSDDEKDIWEETFDEETKEVSGEDLNKFLFNANTVDIVLQQVMEKGIRVEGGERLGKTILFAASKKHADFILKRYNALYPEQSLNRADVIYTGVRYVDDLLDSFKKKTMPRIAISVDMLDTGIDIPELVNLVFFKKVRSKAKFWQMIGRGTRLSPNLFGPELHKTHFLIFDYCGNFEFFRINKDGPEGPIQKSLTERIFNIKVLIAQKLEHLDYQTDSYIEHRKNLVSGLHGAVCSINENLFSSQLRIQFIHTYNRKEKWKSISDSMVRDLEIEIASLIPAEKDDELAKRFDYLMYTIELATLAGLPIGKPKMRVVNTADMLAKKGNLVQIQKQADLISRIQTDEHWDNADLLTHEKVRLALRDLIQLLEKERTETFYTDFRDEIKEVSENAGSYGVSELLPYKARVNAYLKEHKDDLVIFKLRNNKILSAEDIKHLETILWLDLGTQEDYKTTFGDMPLLKLVIGLVGLERDAVNSLFAEFLNDQTLNSQQMEFVNLIVNHIAQNGLLDKKILTEHPFNKYGNVIHLFDGKMDVVTGIVKTIDELNKRAE